MLFSDQIEARNHDLKMNKFLNRIVIYQENIHKLRGRLSQEQRDETDMRENRFLIKKRWSIGMNHFNVAKSNLFFKIFLWKRV